ncbi:transcription elongation factor Spt6 [Calocera cornea HHB12733]|uniref:Transcription elongation factor Spt6 n=1 Tax=Calocera cornea HHB12733 TaxID=1353952 RepID=A0A165E2N7_9BASI|nr:transcription elongation factor Spt6 [Calocera cornea HHB12733]
MSSPLLRDDGDDFPLDAEAHGEREERPAGEEGDEEGEGDDPMMSDDSSEEEEEDPEEARKVREGFIVDEDDEEGGEGDAEDGEQKEKRRKKKHRRHRHRDEEEQDDDMDGELDEDDLMLVEENTGQRIEPERFSRLRRHRSPSPSADVREPKRRRREADEDSLPSADDLANIFAKDGAEDEDEDDLDDFIEEDEEDEEDEDRNLNEEEREQRRRERKKEKKERRLLTVARPELVGIDESAWEDLNRVFGDGHDYDEFLDLDEEEEAQEKARPKVEEIFEPSEIKARMMTYEDDLIRKDDVPERMLLSASSLWSGATYVPFPIFPPGELSSASEWVAMRLGERVKDAFFRSDGRHHALLQPLIMAVRQALEYILISRFEVPYIWQHKRDYISFFDAEGTRQRTDLLTLDELWRIQHLGYRYRALVERRTALRKTFDSLGQEDAYFSAHVWESLDDTEMVADAMEYVSLRHGKAMRDQQELAEVNGEPGMAEVTGDDGMRIKVQKMKRPTRQSAYEVARASTVSGLADNFGLTPSDAILRFLARGIQPPAHEPEISPLTLAEQYAPVGFSGIPEDLLQKARFILATEFGKDPLLRHTVRQKFEKEAVVSTRPTEQGIVKIDEYHPYFRIKYMNKKPISRLNTNTLFLQVLAAEQAGLVTVDISLPTHVLNDFQNDLYKAYASDRFSEVALAWNEQRRQVVEEAMRKHLIPCGVRWIREWLRDEEEDNLSEAVTEMLERRLDAAPYKTKSMEEGDIPSVITLSVGKGEQQDAIVAVYVDEDGRMREHTKFDNLRDENMKAEFREFVKRRKPDVVGIAGFSTHTMRIMEDVQRLVGDPSALPQPGEGADAGGGGGGGGGWSSQAGGGEGGWGSQGANGGGGGGGDAWGSQGAAAGGGDGAWGSQGASGGGGGGGSGGGWGSQGASGSGSGAGSGANSGWNGNDGGWGSRGGANGTNGTAGGDDEKYPDVIYVPDEVARIYQNSARAAQEHGGLSVIARYCVGLARYVQNPLNEYAALGEDLSIVKFDDDQKLLPKAKLLAAMERALVTLVNRVGVDLLRAVSDPYYQHLLRFVCGLGPRKAQALVSRLIKNNGTIENRARLSMESILSWTVFLNAAAFLYIPQEAGKINRKAKQIDEQPDPLDETRIHPEDYQLARKMATDALDMDEEDFVNDHPSAPVAQLMQDDDAAKKLDDLSLDDFAISLLERLKDRKRYTLDMLKEELLNPYREKRSPFAVPNEWQVMTMLTGETRRTLYVGRPVQAVIYRVKQHFALARLDSGVEALINQSHLSDDHNARIDEVLSKGQAVNGIVINVDPGRFQVELATKETALQSAHPLFPKNNIDDFALDEHERDQEALQRKRRREINATRRIIKHPLFSKFNAGQAEQYLANRPNGDVVIRPSSKGHDHLVVTWKVENGLYQHIDVYDPDGGNDQSGIGHRLVVGEYVYSDLDELLVNHVNAMAKRVSDLMEHEKFYKGSSPERADAERRQYLTEFVMANPNKSIYAFGLDRQHPGYFVVDFMVNKNIPMQTWPIKVTPRGYRLLDGGEVPSVPELCNAFKMRYVQQSSQVGSGRPSGGKTPYGAGTTPYGAGGMTPSSRTPGYRTSSHLPVGRTPNPYGGGAAHTPNPYGQTPRPVPPAGGYGYDPRAGGATPAGAGWGGQQAQTPAGGGWGGGGGW